VNNRDIANTVRRFFDGLEGAGLLTETGRKVRGLVMTGQFSQAVEQATGLNAMARMAMTKIVKRTTELDIDDVDFGGQIRCQTPQCLGIARMTCDGRMLCTECMLFSEDDRPAENNVITIEQLPTKERGK
jgi:hypothetical protein